MQAVQWGYAQTHHVSVGKTLLAAPWRYHNAALADFAPDILFHSALPGLPSVSISLYDNYYSSRHEVGCMNISSVIYKRESAVKALLGTGRP